MSLVSNLLPHTLIMQNTASTSISPSIADHQLPRRSLAFVLTVLLAVFMLVLAARAAFDPIGAAHGYGIDLASPLDVSYLYVKAGRDLAIAAVLTALLVYGRTVPLLLTVGALCIAPIVDGILVTAHGKPGYALGVHGSAVAFGFVLVALLVRALRKR